MEDSSLTPVEASVFISGVVSMGLEMVAGRMLAPEFGSSVYTWGSIIGVFMAALALGYHVGGKRSETATRGAISRVFLLSTVYIAILIVSGDQILTASRIVPLPERYLPLIPATVLFGPPSFLLGFVSPYAAQLSSKEVKGEASGSVYALGTAGSIVGTFAATFVLIPYLSVSNVLALMAVGSVAGVIVASWNSRELTKLAGYSFLSLILVFGVLIVQGSASGAVYSTQTPYQQLEIRDSGDVRTLYLNDHPQSAAYINGSTEYPWNYPRYFHLPYLMVDEDAEIDKVLFIGAGGFSGPRRFAQEYDAEVDVVEIDPEVVSAGEQYFNASDIRRMEIHVEDGRRFLQDSDEKYDLVVMDAYQKSSVPFHLTTREFLELVERRTDEDGIFYANLISAPSGAGSKFYRSEYKTADQVFSQVYGFRTSSSPLTQNIQLIATKNPERLSVKQLGKRNSERDIGIDLSTEVENLMDEPKTSDVPFLRDDRAPVDRLTDPLLGTKYVIEGRD